VRQPRPNEPALSAVRCWRTTAHTAPFAPCNRLSGRKPIPIQIALLSSALTTTRFSKMPKVNRSSLGAERWGDLQSV